MSSDSDMHLPEECWECVFRFLNNNNNNNQFHHHYLESLSLVSKQFLSITNRIRFSLAIIDPTLPFLLRLFHRFPNLASLNLTRFHGDLDALLLQISQFPSFPRLTSLDISNHPTFPSNGLRALAEKVKTLTSLTCSHMGSLAIADLQLITDCFPFLQELDLSFPGEVRGNNLNRFRVELLPLALPKLLRKVNLSGDSFFINDAALIDVCKNCEFLEELVIFKCPLITQPGIASAIRERPSLMSFSVNNTGSFVTTSFIDSLVSLKSLTCLDFTESCISDELLCSVAKEGLPLRKLVLNWCRNYTYAGISCLLSRCKNIQHLGLQHAVFLNDQLVAELSLFLDNLISIDIGFFRMLTELALFALTSNCRLLSEIKMEATGIGKNGVYEDSNSLIVNPQVKSLHLAWNQLLGDDNIKMLSFVCPNLQRLDLKSCRNISETSVVQVLRRCGKIRHLSIANCSGVKKLHGMNFEVPNLEVLSLGRYSGIDDEALSVVSKSFCGLLYLDLEHCSNVTDNGVRQVVENCKQLREINLSCCSKVSGSVVSWMVFSRPSLRKIVAPPNYDGSAGQSDLFLRHGCLVC